MCIYLCMCVYVFVWICRYLWCAWPNFCSAPTCPPCAWHDPPRPWARWAPRIGIRAPLWGGPPSAATWSPGGCLYSDRRCAPLLWPGKSNGRRSRSTWAFAEHVWILRSPWERICFWLFELAQKLVPPGSRILYHSCRTLPEMRALQFLSSPTVNKTIFKYFGKYYRANQYHSISLYLHPGLSSVLS